MPSHPPPAPAVAGESAVATAPTAAVEVLSMLRLVKLFFIITSKFVNVKVEENSELTRGETVGDWLGVTNRKRNCFVMNNANEKKFFELLKNKLSFLP